MEHSTALIGPTSGWVGPWSAALSGSLDDCGVCRVGGGVIFVFQIEHIDIAMPLLSWRYCPAALVLKLSAKVSIYSHINVVLKKAQN